MRIRMLACIAFAALAGCGAEAPDDAVNPLLGKTSPKVVTLQEALSTSDIPTLDPHTMNDAEIGKVLGEGRFCAFRYTSEGKPVLAWKPPTVDGTPAAAVVKLNGVLVELQRNADAGGTRFGADALKMTVTPEDAAEPDPSGSGPREAKLLFEIEQQLRVGYGGYLVCPG